MKSLLILALGRRGGSVQYGNHIINELRLAKEVYVSSYSIERSPDKAIQIKTYRNKLEFFFSSIFYGFPLYCKVLLGLFQGKYMGLYLPYTHYWNTAFVATFRLFGLPTVCTVHDGIPHTGDGNIWEAIINRFTIRQASHLVFLSKHVARYIQHKIGFSCPYSVLPHGLLHAGPVSENRQHHNPAKILFLGRICHYKGVDLLLEALKLLDEHLWEEAVIAGQISPDLHFPSSSKKIKWINKWLSQDEVETLLKEADLLVLPYREATQSGVVTLAIHQGLPIVCSRVGGLPEQLGKEDCVWVDPDPTSIADGIQSLIISKELYMRNVNSLEILKKNYSWSKISQAIEALFCPPISEKK